jgi:hypothetical protein
MSEFLCLIVGFFIGVIAGILVEDSARRYFNDDERD